MQTHTYYTPKEAAAFLGVSTHYLVMWRVQGEGPAYVKLDPSPTGRVLYHIRDLKALKAKREGAKRRKGHTSYARRVAEGERFEDLPAFSKSRKA